MKKSIMVKSFIVMLISAMIMFMSTSVFAVDVDAELDLTGNSSSTNSSNTNSANSANTNTNKANTNSNKANTNLNTNGVRTNSANTYNNTSLPKTGIESSLPIALIVVVLGISAIYAYKKIKDYRNI